MGDIVLVTGAAGFVGSHVVERLLADGRNVRGVDAFTDYYPRAFKEENLRGARDNASFELVEADLAVADLAPILDGVTSVCHLAAQAGVRASWGTTFSTYIKCNILSSQRLLEAVKDGGVSKFVYASSSSVYGETTDLPMRENGLTCPVSPYGVTKLAAEHLAVLYHRNYGVPTVSLRYFTVYGPRQRPDMAFHRFIRSGLLDEPITIYGNGHQTRDFTYIDDTVAATVVALESGPDGSVLNVGGGSRVTLNDALDAIEGCLGAALDRRYVERARGDVTDTLADNSRARETLGFRPRVGLPEGLEREREWIESTALTLGEGANGEVG
ncbi:MAG: NAD-dependent epimerase/dehydratase family protein [Candidatus Eisenbacteria bacterium]